MVAIVGSWSGDLPVGNINVVHDGDENEEAAGMTVAAVSEETATPFASAADSDVDVICRLLREVGRVLEAIVDDGSWAGLERPGMISVSSRCLFSPNVEINSPVVAFGVNSV